MIFTFLFSLVLTLNQAGAADPKPCRDYALFSWLLHLSTHKMESLGRAPKVQTICGKLPQAGGENLLVELRDKSGKIVFFRRIFLSLDEYFDYQNSKSEINGGVRANDEPVLTSLFPIDLKGSRIQVKHLVRGKSGQKLLTVGEL